MAHFDPTMPEAWYPVPSLSGYEISSRFRVRSWRVKGSKHRRADSPKPLAVGRMKAGYLYFNARLDGRRLIVYVHHVVAELAHGPRPQGLDVLHEDDVKSNNDPANLYYGTERQNSDDAFRNGGRLRGSGCSQAKLSEADIAEMRRLYTGGTRQRALASRFGVGQGLISRIVNGKRWLHVQIGGGPGKSNDAI